YQPKHVSYTVFDATSTDVLRLTFKPKKVTVDGKALEETRDLSAPGWSWQALDKGGILTIRQTIGRKVEIEGRSEEHTSELQSRENLVCRLLLEKKKQPRKYTNYLQ